MEVDFTRKAKYIIRYGLVSLVAIAAITASVIYYVQHATKDIVLYNAEVKSTLVNVTPKTSGTITELVVENGAHVEAGDVIARVAPSVTPEDIAKLEQAASLAQKSLEELQKGQTVTVPVPAVASSDGSSQQRVANAEARLQRMNELFDMGAISASKRDEAAAEYEAAKASATTSTSTSATYRSVVQPTDPNILKNAQLQLKQAQAALEAAKKASNVTEIVAAVSGTVYYDDLQIGTQIKTDTPIATIGNDNDLRITVTVPADKIDSVHLGQLASYTLDGKRLQGSVQEIEEDMDDDSGDSNTVATISIPTEDAEDISPGMTTDIALAKDN